MLVNEPTFDHLTVPPCSKTYWCMRTACVYECYFIWPGNTVHVKNEPRVEHLMTRETFSFMWINRPSRSWHQIYGQHFGNFSRCQTNRIRPSPANVRGKLRSERKKGFVCECFFLYFPHNRPQLLVARG